MQCSNTFAGQKPFGDKKYGLLGKKIKYEKVKRNNNSPHRELGPTVSDPNPDHSKGTHPSTLTTVHGFS